MQGSTKKNLFQWLMIWIIASIFLVITLWAVASFLVPPRPNLILITIDTLRADRLGCYGYTQADTPNLDRIAAQGVLCTQAYSQSPLTFPSHATLLTGTSPIFHGVRDNGGYRFPSNIPTLATILYKKGYQTAAVVSSATLSRSKGLDVGFQTYEDVTSEEYSIQNQDHTAIAERDAQTTLLLAKKRWQELEYSGNPYFLWVHLFDPHAEYNPPPSYKEEFANDLYQGEIAYVDDCLRKLISELDPNRVLLVITADHGEGLGEHGELSHGYFLYNSTLHVPLMFWGANIPSKQKFDFPIRTMDIMPTVLSIMDIHHYSQSQGQDFSAWICQQKNITQPRSNIPQNPSIPPNHTPTSQNINDKLPPQVAIYAETYYNHHAYGWRILRSLQYNNYKYHDTRLGELYNIADDSKETINLLASHKITNHPIQSENDKIVIKELVEQFKLRLAAYTQTTQPGAIAAISNQDAAQLYGLGYVSGYIHGRYSQGTSFADNDTLPDPTEMITVLDILRKAQTLMAQKQDSQVIPLLESALQQDPNNLLALSLLGKTSARTQRWFGAISSYQKLNELQPDWLMPKQALVDIFLEMQNWPEAQKYITDAMEHGGKEDAMILSRLAYLQLMQGQFNQAQESAQKAVWKDNRLPSAWFYLGWALQEQQQYYQAIPAFEQALRWGNEAWPEAYYRYGQCLAQVKSFSQARWAFETALQYVSPGHPLYHSIQKEWQNTKE